MPITFTKEASKAVVIAMENAGLDTMKFAIEVGMKNDDITLAFLKMADSPKKYIINHGLYLYSDASLSNFIVDYGTHNGNKGLFFSNKEKNVNKSNRERN